MSEQRTFSSAKERDDYHRRMNAGLPDTPAMKEARVREKRIEKRIAAALEKLDFDQMASAEEEIRSEEAWKEKDLAGGSVRVVRYTKDEKRKMRGLKPGSGSVSTVRNTTSGMANFG